MIYNIRRMKCYDDQSTRNKNNHDHQLPLLLPLDLNNMNNSFTGLSGLVISFNLLLFLVITHIYSEYNSMSK